MNFIFERIEEIPNTGVVNITFSTADGMPEECLDGLQFQISEVRPLRDNLKTSIGIADLPASGMTKTISASGFDSGLYMVTSVTSNAGSTGKTILHPTSGALFFDIPLTLSPEQAQAEIKRIQNEREALVTTPLIAENACEESPEFAAVIYYSGVRLHNAFVLSGAEVYPVRGSLGLEGMEGPLVDDLAEIFGQKFEFSDLLKRDYSVANNLFAVRFFKIHASEPGYAAGFAREFADDIVSLIATERGEKPVYCATFVKGKEGYAFYTAPQKYRGNLLSPLHSNEQAELIERYHPVVKKSDYARFLITLLSEAIGERNPAFQYWRSWAILEQIANRHITSDNQDLYYPNGSQIFHPGGNPAKTKAKGKVYQYLIQNNWSCFDLVKKADDGRAVRIEGADIASHDSSREMIGLWDALGAMYGVRNKVAHTGAIVQSTTPTAEEALANQIAGDGPFITGFLYSMVNWAVWREVELERTQK